MFDPTKQAPYAHMWAMVNVEGPHHAFPFHHACTKSSGSSSFFWLTEFLQPFRKPTSTAVLQFSVMVSISGWC